MQWSPVGPCDSPDIFQEKMSSLMEGLEFVCVHMEDPLVITSRSFKDHLAKLETALDCLQKASLKVNINKSSFHQVEIECSGCWITRDHIEPPPKKVEAVEKMAKPKNKTKLCLFLGSIDYC